MQLIPPEASAGRKGRKSIPEVDASYGRRYPSQIIGPLDRVSISSFRPLSRPYVRLLLIILLQAERKCTPFTLAVRQLLRPE